MQRDRRAVYQKKKKEATLVTRLGDNAVIASDSLGIMQCEQMKRQEKRATSILTPIAEERVNRNDRGKARHDEYRIKRRQNKNTGHQIITSFSLRTSAKKDLLQSSALSGFS